LVIAMDEQERRRRVIDEARATLEQTSDVKADLQRRLINMPVEDPLKKWRADAAERDRQRAAGREQLRQQERTMQADMQTELVQLVDARVGVALETERQLTTALLIELTAKLLQAR
jgi:hypothetical protein